MLEQHWSFLCSVTRRMSSVCHLRTAHLRGLADRTAVPIWDSAVASDFRPQSGQTSPKPRFADSSAYWLTLYFIFNLGLTLFNKMVLVGFPYPFVSPALTMTPKELADLLDLDSLACDVGMCWKLLCAPARCLRSRSSEPKG